MPARYTYQHSPEYISGLKFDYIETYSFQRGEIFDAQHQKEDIRFRLLTEINRTRGLDAQEEADLSRLKTIREQGYIVDRDGKFHWSAERKSLIQRDDKIADRLSAILSTPATDVPAWMCAPVYRDAIIFYNANGSNLSALNICFSCEYMATAPFAHINADVSVYKDLKVLLSELGHMILEK